MKFCTGRLVFCYLAKLYHGLLRRLALGEEEREAERRMFSGTMTRKMASFF
jgi:hypothetical protein